MINNNNQTANYQANEYIFDLGTIALENGFKANEVWDVQIATAAEKNALEKQYYPTVVTSILPDLVNETFALVMAKLDQVAKIQTSIVLDRFAPAPVYEYLVAFNSARTRR